MPLFDRLVDHDPHATLELQPMRTLDRRGVRESVRRELELLFNTRCPFASHHLGDRPRTVIDYGIPDLSIYSARNFNDQRKLADTLRDAIAAYEPRLANARVRIGPVPGDEFSLAAEIDADLMVDAVPTPVSFRTLLQIKEGLVSVT